MKINNDLIKTGITLWTNSNPTSSFPSQTITLSESLNNYGYYEIFFRQNTTTARVMTTGKIPVGNGTILDGVTGGYRATGATISGTSIFFENAQNSGGINNGETIPVEVIAYKH